MKKQLRLILFAALLIGLSTSYFGQTLVGEVAAASIESPHPIAGELWQQQIEVAGARVLKVHLASLKIGPDDLLVLLDGQGQEVYRQQGPSPGGTWLPAVMGDVLMLEVWPAHGSTPWGIVVDRVAHGYPAGQVESQPTPESICGTTDWQDAACYQSDAGKWAAGDAVGQVTFISGGGLYSCSGSLVSANNHFLTNNHCISTETEAQSADFYWRFQFPSCGSGSWSTDSTSTKAHLIVTDPVLDYSLIQIYTDTPADRYGYETLNPNVPSVGDVMWIAEHPLGGPKKFAVNSDMDGGLAKVQALGLIGGNGDVNGGPSDIGYYADTERGSSGSPVFDANNAVVALHHFGLAGSTCKPSDMNQGVEMALVYPHIAPYLDQVYFVATAGANLTSGLAPLTVHFTGSAAGGSSPYTYDWDFGDGSAHSSEQNPTHTYATPGTYAVTLTAGDTASHSATDSHLSIQARAPVTPPAISSVRKVGNPFRIKIYGTNFHQGCTVKIDGVAVPLTKWKSDGLVVAKKGHSLKAMVPKGQEVQITVTNNDDLGVSSDFAYTR